MTNVKDIMKKLSPRRRGKVMKRAAELIAEHKANANRKRNEKNRYHLSDLIGETERREPTEEDRQWLDAPPVGKEKL